MVEFYFYHTFQTSLNLSYGMCMLGQRISNILPTTSSTRHILNLHIFICQSTNKTAVTTNGQTDGPTDCWTWRNYKGFLSDFGTLKRRIKSIFQLCFFLICVHWLCRYSWSDLNSFSTCVMNNPDRSRETCIRIEFPLQKTL